MLLNKRAQHSPSVGREDFSSECELSTLFPAVYSFVTTTQFAGGEKRTPGSITLFRAQEGGLRLCMNDKDSEETAFVSGASLSELLSRANDGLESGNLDWRTQKRKPQGRKS